MTVPPPPSSFNQSLPIYSFLHIDVVLHAVPHLHVHIDLDTDLRVDLDIDLLQHLVSTHLLPYVTCLFCT